MPYSIWSDPMTHIALLIVLSVGYLIGSHTNTADGLVLGHSAAWETYETCVRDLKDRSVPYLNDCEFKASIAGVRAIK